MLTGVNVLAQLVLRFRLSAHVHVMFFFAECILLPSLKVLFGGVESVMRSPFLSLDIGAPFVANSIFIF